MATFLKTVLTQISRLGGTSLHHRWFHHAAGPVCVQSSQMLQAAPLKKKKKSDHSASLTQRRKKRLEKELKYLQKLGRNLKPVEEIEFPLRLLREKETRSREREVATFEESEQAVLLLKKWQTHKLIFHAKENEVLSRAKAAQEKALRKLREESEELYQMAIQVDDDLLQYEYKGPVETPPIEDFEPVDGDYVNISRTFRE